MIRTPWVLKAWAVLVIAAIPGAARSEADDAVSPADDEIALEAEGMLDAWLAGEEAPPPPPVLPPPSTDFEVVVHAGAGYKKNVLFSSVQPLDSGFSTIDGELYLARDFSGARDLFVYLSANQRHYFELDRGSDDQSVVAEAAWSEHPGWIDTIRLTGTYTYYDQFFDNSLSDLDIDSFRVRQHDGGGELGGRHRLGERWTVRADVAYHDVEFLDSPDDYSTWWARAGADWDLSARTRLSADVEQGIEDYDERACRTATGDLLPDGTVDIRESGFEMRLRTDLDAARRWQLRIAGAVASRDDNAGGYYDYARWRGRVSLRYRASPLEIEGALRYTVMDYDTRPALFDTPAGETLERSWWTAWLRAEYEVRAPWRCFVEVAWEDYDSNDPLSVYEHGWVAGGVGIEY